MIVIKCLEMTLGKSINPLILPCYGLNSASGFLDGFGNKNPVKVDMPLSKETKPFRNESNLGIA